MPSLLLALLLAQAPAAAPAPADAASPVRLSVGETVTLPVPGPALQLICDDLAVVRPEVTAGGLRLTGASVGKTLCSVLSTRYSKVVYEVTVAAK